MCEAKPGTRCATDTRDAAAVTLRAYENAHQGGPAVDPLNAAAATWKPVASDTTISVLNPDAPDDMPIFEGSAADATTTLMPGRYFATDLDGQSTYELTVGAQPTPVTIEGEWAPGMHVSAVTFPDADQGFGEPVYWADADSVRALHDHGGFGAKSDFDDDASSSYLSFAADGTPIEHTGVDNDDGTTDPTRTTTRELASREYQGRTYYSLEGYAFDEAHSEYGYGTPDDDSVCRVVAQSGGLDDEQMDRLAEEQRDQDDGAWSEDFSRARQAASDAREAYITQSGEDPSDLDWPSSRAAGAVTHQLRFGTYSATGEIRGASDDHPAWGAQAAASDAARAVAMRSLIGKAPGWNQQAYDTLTGVWRRNIGPLHPDDGPAPARWGA